MLYLFPFFVVVFPLWAPIPTHIRCRIQFVQVGVEVEFEMNIPRQIGGGNNVGMIESVVGSVEMMANEGRRFVMLVLDLLLLLKILQLLISRCVRVVG